ncbi:hypothetical protein DFH28DRAFT_922138 [Melampsora americana]|nr:hypothetical protein DFH28DRAFT_922138 [Melampsora americana]
MRTPYLSLTDKFRVGTNTSGKGAPNNLLLSIDLSCPAFIDVKPGRMLRVRGTNTSGKGAPNNLLLSIDLSCPAFIDVEPGRMLRVRGLREDKKRNLLRVLRELRIRNECNPNSPGIIKAMCGFFQKHQVVEL